MTNKRSLLLAFLVAAALPAAAADRIPIVDEGALGTRWTLVPDTALMPPYPEAHAKDAEEVCLVVGYLVNADGRTSDFSVLKSWTSGNNSRGRKDFWEDFAGLSSRALARWRYAPGDTVAARPVYTAATFVFGAPGAMAATREHCAVADLGARLAELQHDPRAGVIMARGIYDQLDIDPGRDFVARSMAARNDERIDRRRTAEAVYNEKAASRLLGN